MGRFQIVFDNPTNAFFAGTDVLGKVHLSLDQPKKVRALSIKFKGVAKVRFTAQEREVVHHHNHHHTSTPQQPNHTGGSRTEHRTVTHTYTAEEEYYSYKYNLEGDGNNETIIPAGVHVYHFSATLPTAIPSSFEGKHGHVQYTVTATLVRPWKFDEHAKAVFEVVSPLDLNYNIKAKEPVRIGLDKSFCCFWCRSGPLQLIVSLPCAGFIPGQTIPITIEIDNASRVDVDNIVISLNKILEWRARSPSIKQKVDKVDLLKLSLDGVKKNGTRSMVQMLTVPNVSPVNLDQCNIIYCNFNLTVTALVAGCHKNLVAEAQIFIGTVPLYNSPGLPSNSFAPVMPSAPELLPSAPVGFNVDPNGFDSKMRESAIAPTATQYKPMDRKSRKKEKRKEKKMIRKLEKERRKNER